MMLRRHSENGFTLIEVLVSLALFALILTLLPGSLKLGRRAWEAAGDIGDRANAEAALSFAGQRLAEAMPLVQAGPDGTLGLAFKGSARTVSFIAPFDGGPMGPGPYRLEFDTPQDRAAVLRVFPPKAARGEPDPPLLERSLGEDIAGLAFRYFGAPSAEEAKGWQPEWTRTDRLPDLIEMTATRLRPAGTAASPTRVELKLRRPG